MRNKFFAGLLCTLLLLSMGFSPVRTYAETVDEVQSLIDGIVDFQLNSSGADSVQDWINSTLTANAGSTSEWYILALSQNGTNYDFSSYEAALTSYLSGTTVASATSRQKYALVLIAVGSSNTYISEALHSSIGMQGIMSWVYGLHLLNNGYTSDSYNAGEIVSQLLSMQLSDGGWALSGSVSDVDVTAMTVQALAPYYSANKAAIDRAVSLLSQKQLDSGDYASYGVANPESTAQVITALSALGIDCLSDSRFIKNGNTLLDGIAKYQLADGSISHTEGGAFNQMATVQVFYGLTAYIRQQRGGSSLYLLDNRSPEALSGTAPAPTEAPAVQTNTPAVSPSTEGQTVRPDAPAPTETECTAAETMQTSTFIESTAGTAGTNRETTITAINSSTAVSPTTSTESTETEVITESEPNTEENGSRNSGGYKPWACLIVIGIGGTVCLILFLVKKRHPKNFIAVVLLTGLGIVFICLTNFQSAEDYYHGENSEKANSIGTVTMTIRCDTITDKGDGDYIPKDGVILDVTAFSIADGDTVFTILTEAAQAYGIQLEYSGSPKLAYVSGINYIYEFEFGDLSGWVYHVNGTAPSVGCGEYLLTDGDVIEWHYTCDLGNDVNK